MDSTNHDLCGQYPNPLDSGVLDRVGNFRQQKLFRRRRNWRNNWFAPVEFRLFRTTPQRRKMLGILKRAVWWIRDVYPGSWFLPIPDPGSKTATKERGEKKNFVIPFYVATNFTKLNIILVWSAEEKNFSKNYRTFYPKFVPKLLKIWVRDPGSEDRDPGSGIQDPGSGIRDPGSGIRRKPISDPGSRGQKGTGYRIWIRNTGNVEQK
jgi:hypothetical protein